MRHKLKAVFDDRTQAQQALDVLLASGYARADTGLASIAGARSAPTGDAPPPKWRERPGASTARLLSRLLGHAGSRPATAPATGKVDSHVLTLWTDSTHDATRAAGLIAGFMRTGGEEVGTRPFGGRTDIDQAARAAYRFGHDLHENARYRNRSWHEAHADLKVLWEARDPDSHGWDLAALAVRLGWDSTHPEIDDDSYRRSHWRTRYANNAQDAGASRGPGSDLACPAPGSAPGCRHPGQPTAWENFMDAVKHGWSRIRVGNDMDEDDYRLHHDRTHPGRHDGDLAPVTATAASCTAGACSGALAGMPRRTQLADFVYSPPSHKKRGTMELTNEVTLDGDVYCFEDAERVAEARAWIDANGKDTARFRNAFPDARPVSTHPYGSGSQRRH